MNESLAMATSIEATPIAREPVLSTDDPRWQRLRALIETHSLLRGDFILASGRRSNFLFQLRETTMRPEGQALVGAIVEEFMRRHGLATVGGMVQGAVPVACATAFASHLSGHPVDAFFIRKTPKSHGARERIDGPLAMGADALVVDDVTTTGGSLIEAVDAIRAEREANVAWGLSVVDRDEGAAEALAARGLRLASIFTKADFGL
jgi:orotate phosphoribosyltransferase